jgi:hypothetical protein
MVVHTVNLSTQETEAGGSWVSLACTVRLQLKTTTKGLTLADLKNYCKPAIIKTATRIKDIHKSMEYY